MQSKKGSLARGFNQGGHGENVAWAGEQWSYKVDKEKVNTIQGSANIVLHDTEAAIVFLH